MNNMIGVDFPPGSGRCEADVDAMRHHLVERGFCLTRDVAGDPDFATLEANIKAELPELLGELNRNDLIALFKLAQALAAFPPHEWSYPWPENTSAQRKTRRARAREFGELGLIALAMRNLSLRKELLLLEGAALASVQGSPARGVGG